MTHKWSCVREMTVLCGWEKLYKWQPLVRPSGYPLRHFCAATAMWLADHEAEETAVYITDLPAAANGWLAGCNKLMRFYLQKTAENLTGEKYLPAEERGCQKIGPTVPAYQRNGFGYHRETCYRLKCLRLLRLKAETPTARSTVWRLSAGEMKTYHQKALEGKLLIEITSYITKEYDEESCLKLEIIWRKHLGSAVALMLFSTLPKRKWLPMEVWLREEEENGKREKWREYGNKRNETLKASLKKWSLWRRNRHHWIYAPCA